MLIYIKIYNPLPQSIYLKRSYIYRNNHTTLLANSKYNLYKNNIYKTDDINTNRINVCTICNLRKQFSHLYVLVYVCDFCRCNNYTGKF